MEREKLKNIKDLEYSHVLSKQNISLVLIGTAIIYIIFTEKLPMNFNKIEMILPLILVGVVFIVYFSKKLEKIKEEIKEI